MINLVRGLLAAIAVYASSSSACTPLNPSRSIGDRIAQAFRESESVLIGTVESVEKLTVKSRGMEMPIERATFRVDLVFKGSMVVGETLTVDTSLSPGSCGQSAINDPPWLEEATDDGIHPASISKQWVLFNYESSPGLASPSSPVDLFPCPVSRLSELIADQTANICE